MSINPISSTSFTGKERLLAQTKKIINKAMGTDTRVVIHQGRQTDMTIRIPGKKGFISVSGELDPVSLAEDFAKVQAARKSGILKTERVSKFNL